MSSPGNPNMPPIEDTTAVARQYIGAIDAGASLGHHHGVHYLEKQIAADGRRLSHTDFDGWRDLAEKSRAEREPIMQFRNATARRGEKGRRMERRQAMMPSD